MKTLKLLSLLLIGAIAFTSCKNNMSLTKRHYTKGYYFHKNKSVEQPEFKEGVASNNSKKTGKASPIEILQVEPTQSTTAQTSNAIANQNFTASTSKKISHTNSNKKNNTTEVKSLNQTKKELQQNSKQPKKSAAKGDANLVLMVILAIFPILCLIAVYLHDGGITKNFWIDLILHITFIGMIIYALLVVLDVVDFA
jgi:uncharacterized membrane protein YqaE (UPF0057 family)